MKRLILALLLISSLLLCACGELFDDLNERLVELADDTMSTIIGNESQDDENASDIKEIATLDELRDYIHEQKDKDILEIDFKYVGRDKLDDEQIVVIAAVCSITYSVNDSNEYHLSLTEYPGDRIADAYKSKDTSKLNSDEREAYDIAIDMIERARDMAESEIELELILHDMIIDKVTYYDGTTSISDPMNPPRHLTAVGALVDGKANCQGYSDAFYTLATMAGFQVGRMAAKNSDGGHMLNTILLDGKWYVVDTTFDDAGGPGFYFLFNAGRELCREYAWGSEMENNPISDKTDEKYYYYRNNSVYDDIEALAQGLFDEWHENRSRVVHAMITQNVTPSELSEALKDVDMPEYSEVSYTIWCHTNGVETFFAVEFE